MSDGKLNNLLAALREVAADAPDPNDDPDAIDDPADDDCDPLDDPRSYPDEDADQNENEETDFRRRKPLGTVMLLERLEQQSQLKTDKDRSLAARQRRMPLPPTKLEQKNAKLLQMRRKADKAEYELKLNKQLKAETLRLQKANVKLYKANLTAQDRMELENSDWREEARAAFGSQYYPPVNGCSAKKP